MNHSHLSDLKQKAHNILQKDKQAHEEALIQKMNMSLKDLELKLQESTKNVVITIESDMQKVENSSKLLTKSSMKIFIFNLMLSMSLILGLFMGSFGIAKYLSNQIMTTHKEISLIEQKIVTKEKLLKEIQTLGLELVNRANQEGVMEQFIILPQGMTVLTGYTNGEQNAIKLVKE